MKKPINILLTLAIEHECEDICSEVLANDNFARHTASCKYSGKELHHYGIGGLAQHTCEVAELIEECALTLSISKKDNIANDAFLKKCIIAAVFHDFGKLWDYAQNKDGEWVKTEHARTIGHIARSAMEFQRVAEKYNMPQNDKDDILHAILAHHGQREWGSPVSPKTKLAWLLHLCDNMSARYEDCDRIDFVK